MPIDSEADETMHKKTEEKTVAQAIVEINKRREEIREEIRTVEPDTTEETGLWGEYRGLRCALNELSFVPDHQLPEWQIGVENDEGDWEWYYPRAINREAAELTAMDGAEDDLGGRLNVYEVGGPIAQ